MEQPQSVEKSMRIRVAISISVKGQRTWDVTTEGTGYTRAEMLEESDALVREMEHRYPAPINV
jgi:hypothetical protein